MIENDKARTTNDEARMLEITLGVYFGHSDF